MSESEPIRLPLAPLNDLLAWLQKSQVPFVVIGGVAASILGRPRVTNDVDILVMLSEDRWDGFLAEGRQFVEDLEKLIAYHKKLPKRRKRKP